MKTLLVLTLSGSALALLLLGLRYFALRRMPSTVYYYAWLLVLLRFALPLPGLIPTTFETKATETPVYSETYIQDYNEQILEPELDRLMALYNLPPETINVFEFEDEERDLDE